MFDHKVIEKKWSEKWIESGLYKTKEDDAREKYYILDMFPYPSGAGLHVGHPKGYIATDIFARMKTMQGYNVLHPMGWDAFGLPAENFAIKNKVHPRISTDKNIETFKSQLGLLGFSYDWTREINTTDPGFYKWTQWIFLKLFEKGLAFESYDPINWCPSCKTGLANEDLEGGRCERCDSEIERKPMRQWVLKITDYADRMLDDLEKLPDWDESIKEMQKNWIGRSEGARAKFPVVTEKKKKFKKIYFATGNESKIRRMQKLFSKVDPDIKIEPVPELIDVDEVKDNGLDNSKDKVLPYRGKYDVPVIANDTSVFIDGENFDPTHVKRTALNGVDEKDLTQEQIAEKMKDYYIEIAKKNGGEKEFYYKYDWSMLMPDGDIKQVSSRKECVLIDKMFKELDIYFPMRSLYYSKVTGKNTSEQTEEEYFLEFKAQIDSFKLMLAKAREVESLEVFTTRPDTLFGATYMVVAPEHEIIKNQEKEIKNQKEINNYIKKAQNKSDLERTELNKDKTGVKIEGLVAINPVNNEEIPVYVADYVLAGYGTGAIMAVPAHDERDFEFAEKYGLEIREVVSPGSVGSNKSASTKELFSGNGVNVNSGFLDGLETEEAKTNIIDWLEENSIGERAINYKLRDWVFSRQRYWGEPIPIVHCEKCGAVPLPESELPLELPEVEHYEPSGTGESPLATIDEWVNTTCPKCGDPAKRETNTMPQWAGSSWYYLRFIDPNNDKALVDKNKEKYWSPVDFYVGGAEHATRHLIYARFWHKFLYDIGVVSHDEPFKRLQHVGLIMAEDGRKMSKRWGNVINPNDIVEEYGADAMRVYEMFMGPFSQSCAWNTKGLIGARKFLEKIWKIKNSAVSENGDTSKSVLNLLHKTIRKVGEDVEGFKFNTAISSMMILVNAIEKDKTIARDDFEKFLTIFAPFAPHFCEEIWEELGSTDSIFKQDWPKFDANLARDEMINLVVQINGKLRDTLEVEADIEEEKAKELAMASEKIKKWTEGKEIVKVIYVKGKLVSIVVK